MANMIEHASIFQEELDRQMIALATSGWMEENAGQVQYNGGNEVKVPVIKMDGLADYDRGKGFVSGAMDFKYKTMEMTQDRGRTFLLDAMDVNETNFVLNAGSVMGEFQRTHVADEIDAYRYSKIASLAITNDRVTKDFVPDASNVLQQLRNDIYKIWDEIGDSASLVISLNTKVAQILESSDKISRMLNVADFKKGEMDFKVKTLDDCPLIKVPSARMHTEYLFKDGSAGQEEGGFEKTETAKPINWLITAKSVPIAVSKTDKIRIFDPNTTQNADAWKIDYRKYHDLWIMHNKIKGIWANIQ